MLALTRRKWKSLLKQGVLNEQMTQDLSQKAEEYSKEAEARKDKNLGDEADFDLDAMDADAGDGEEMTFDLTGDGGGEDSDDGIINI